MVKRDFLKLSLITTVGSILPKWSWASAHKNLGFELPKLDFQYGDLEPYIDGRTMEIHYTKHHQSYVSNLNNLLASVKNAPNDIETLCKNISQYSQGIRNNGGGHYNHTFFWKSLAKPTNQAPKPKTLAAINKAFGSFDEFKTKFTDAALSRFGSGWAWLILDGNNELKITSTANQDNPLMDVVEQKGKPILAIDVWEHAYYLQYQNRRKDYIESFYNVVNWDEVERRLEKNN
jgi:Fe-Mn family superoxide dismutase